MTKTKYKIVQEHERCVGCGFCVSSCPENWVIGDDGKSKPKKTIIDEDELKCNKKAEEACPLKIIKIFKVEEE